MDDIHLYSIRDILGNGISFAASKFYESRAYCRDLHRVGPRGEKGLLAGAGQVHRWLELVAKLGGKNRWQEPIQNRWLVAGANSGHQLYLATRIGGQVHPWWPGRDLWPVKLPPIALVS